MGVRARFLSLGLAVVTYLVAAKAHGRQLRLEREMVGIWDVSFRARNPPFVEALWQRERMHYRSTAAVVFVALAAFRVLAERPRIFGSGSVPESLAVHALGPLTVAFVATGIASAIRLAMASSAGLAPDDARPAGWLGDAALGSAFWWALSLSLVVALLSTLVRGGS